MTLRLCVLLREVPGQAAALHSYEDAVLALLSNHGASLRSRDVVDDRATGDPLEIQRIELPDEAALDAFLADPRRVAMDDRRRASIVKTQLLRLS